jgi:hypothetical protein
LNNKRKRKTEKEIYMYEKDRMKTEQNFIGCRTEL